MSDLRAALVPLPVRALRIDADTQAALSEIAVTRIGELYPLPRAELTARFNPILLLRLDQALGNAFEYVQPIQPAPPPRVWRDFAGPVTQIEAVELTVRDLLDELARELAQRESGVTRLTLTLDRVDAQQITEPFNLSRPCRDAKHLWSLVRPVVERVNLGFGVERVTLTATQAARLAHHQSDFVPSHDAIDPARSAGEIAKLIDRVADRFGPERVRCADIKPTHVPESLFPMRPITHAGPVSGATGGLSASALGRTAHILADKLPVAPVISADRPSVLCAPPVAIDVTLLAPDGPILSFRLEGATHHVTCTIGPERITLSWWPMPGAQHDRPSTERTRDYFKLQDQTGRWWWLFRQPRSRRWFAHGWWS
jgi:protein ImuB